MTGSSVAWSRTFRMGQTAVLLTRQVSPQVTCSSGSPWRETLMLQTSQSTNTWIQWELAEIEQVVSQARCANRSKGLESDAQRETRCLVK